MSVRVPIEDIILSEDCGAAVQSEPLSHPMKYGTVLRLSLILSQTDGTTVGGRGWSCDPMPMFVAHARFQFAAAPPQSVVMPREGGAAAVLTMQTDWLTGLSREIETKGTKMAL